jgi:transglutaminase-like putative cysteine protease
MQSYLSSGIAIDIEHPAIIAAAARLADGLSTDAAVAQKCFEFVRDEIKHSWDFRCNPVTCKASDVLSHGTGYCFAKSHLLAALLRANRIPAGLCYQRLSLGVSGPPYCLHGLNAVYLEQFGWYRIDARGNKKGVNAQFTPPREMLAFPIREPEEWNLPKIYSEPLPVVVHVLETSQTVEEVFRRLPDISSKDTAFAD